MEFNFKDVIIRYDDGDPRWRLIYVFYLSNNHEYNKEINSIICDMGYTRNRLIRSYPLTNDRAPPEYERLGIYISKEHEEELERERKRRESIRNAPILSGNKI